MQPQSYSSANATSMLPGLGGNTSTLSRLTQNKPPALGGGSTNPLSNLTINNPSMGLSIPANSPLRGANLTAPTVPTSMQTNTNQLTGSPALSSAGAPPVVSNFLASIKPNAPTSPVTKTQVGSFGGGAASPTGGVVHSSPAVLPNGSLAAVDVSGNVVGGNGFSIDTSGPVSSNALGSNYTQNDVTTTRNQYQDYVQGLANAQQYSPQYLADVAAANKAKLGEATLQNNLNQGIGFEGATTGYAQANTNRSLGQNALEQLAANQAVSVDEMRRQGNIAGAKSLADAYAPTTVSPGSSLVSPVTGQASYGGTGAYSDYQAQQTYFNLAQNFPDAQVPTYNPQLSAQANLQIAQAAAARSPSFQARSTIPVTLPGGGYALVNKNQVAGYRGDGTAIIVSPAQGAQADALKTSIGTLTNQASQIQSQISTVDNNFPILTNIVQKYGLNQTVPLLNQFQQNVGGQLGQTGVVQLNSIVTGLKATIAQIISRGGQVDDKTRNEADSILPNNVSYQVLNDLYGVVKQEGAGVLKGMNDQIQQNTNSLNNLFGTSSSSTQTSTGSGGGGYIDASQANW